MSVADATDAAFITRVVDRAGLDGSRPALAAAARSLARSCGLVLEEAALSLFDGAASADVGAVDIGDDPARAASLLGTCFEALRPPEQRVVGAHHTPPDVARRVAELALADRAPRSVCDPAVGGGVFLLAVAEHLHRAGHERSEVLPLLWGFDTDPQAIAVTEASLALWAGGTPSVASSQLTVGDFLDPSVQQRRPSGGWELVVGNPPFQSQLTGRTARSRERGERLRKRFGRAAAGYVDEAGLFVLAATEHLAAAGRAALIVPASLLAASDASSLRDRVTAATPIQSIWVPGRQLFAASVDVVVPIFERTRSAQKGSITVWVGGAEESAGPMAVPSPGRDWSSLLAAAEGVPHVELDPAEGVVADLATATAGFRQLFYGLAGAVTEAPGHHQPGTPRLLTVGLVDPVTDWWGQRATRLAGTDYRAPVVETERIEDAEIADWVAARLRPKLVVATQTRVIEAVADAAGVTVPSTPLISVEPLEPEDIWRVLAVLCAPPVTAWLHRHAAGGGLSAGRIRPTAARLRAVPLPGEDATWAAGAARAEEASSEPDPDRRREVLHQLASLMTEAYGAPPTVYRWWQSLLPRP